LLIVTGLRCSGEDSVIPVLEVCKSFISFLESVLCPFQATSLDRWALCHF
jgi:hypothetical protein